MMTEISDKLCLSEELIDAYLKGLANKGIKQTAINKYRAPLKDLLFWAGENKSLTADGLKAWRKAVESRGYAKKTVQTYVATVNTFLRWAGYETICIPKPPKLDLTNQIFGYLRAIEPTGQKSRKDIVWRCMCKCGKETAVPATLLVNMNTTSCGCLRTEKIQYAQRFVAGTSLRASLKDNPRNSQSKSGYTGVLAKGSKWIAKIQYKKVVYYLGTFSKLEDAVKARARAKELVMEDAQRLYDETAGFFGEMPKRPPKSRNAKTVQPSKNISSKARRKDNTSGHTGVRLKDGRWYVDISYKKARYNLGYYDSINEAVSVRKQAEQYIQSGQTDELKKMSKTVTAC